MLPVQPLPTQTRPNAAQGRYARCHDSHDSNRFPQNLLPAGYARAGNGGTRFGRARPGDDCQCYRLAAVLLRLTAARPRVGGRANETDNAGRSTGDSADPEDSYQATHRALAWTRAARK